MRASQVSIGQTSLTIILKKSKTSQFSSPAPIHVGANNSSSCPVSALRAYLRHRSVPSTSPLFLFPDGSRRKLVTTMLKRLLQDADLNPSSHSLGLQHLLPLRAYPNRPPSLFFSPPPLGTSTNCIHVYPPYPGVPSQALAIVCYVVPCCFQASSAGYQ